MGGPRVSPRQRTEEVGFTRKGVPKTPLHDFLFEHQKEITRDNLPGKMAQLTKTLSGFDRGKFAACVREGRTATDVDEEIAFAQRSGVNATPPEFVNNVRAKFSTVEPVRRARRGVKTMIDSSGLRSFAIALPLGLVAAWVAPAAQRKPSTGTSAQEVSSCCPLLDLANLLQATYAQVVTYEDPIWVWQGELVPMGPNANAKWALRPKDRTFLIPAGLEPGRAPALSLSLLEALLDSYHHQADGARFRVISSALGFHIIPTEAMER